MQVPDLPVLKRLAETNLVSAQDQAHAFGKVEASAFHGTEESALEILSKAGELTPFQVSRILDGKLDELVLGNYVVLSKLGAGGMGAVYKARHKRMKRIVALKMLNKEMLDSSAGVQRFQREVESIAKLSHPGVVAAYDADEGPMGHFLVMEFVEGDDLLNLVTKNGAFNVPRVVDTMLQAAKALGYVHAQGMVHRDIKPANFLVDGSGRVKVADLGLVRLESNEPAGASTEMEGITQACTIAGTLEYMAPEQAMDTKSADARADIYSLGCTLWFLLTGKVVYPADTQMKKVLAHQNEPIPSLKRARPDAPPLLEAIFKRMVAKTTTDRYQTMEEVVADLEKVQKGLGNPAPAPVPTPPADDSTQMVSREELMGAAAKPAAPPASATHILPESDAPKRLTSVGLLVEPSRTQGMMIAKQLEKTGLTAVHRATSAGGALEALQDHPIGLVITTYLLPDMTGLDLLARLRGDADLRGIPFLLISSLDEKLELPPDAALSQLHKPFTPEQLAQSVRDLQARAGAGKRSPGSLKVLLADDSPSARRRMRMALAELGFIDIVEAQNGKEAAGISDGQKFDLICTDFQMPEMTGGEFTAHARRGGPNAATPILMCTSETDPQLLDEVRRAGVSRLVGKTASNQELAEAIKMLAGI